MDDRAVRPGGLHDLPASHRIARPGREARQDAELGRCEVRRLAAARRGVGPRVEAQLPDLGGEVAPCTLHQRVEAGDELREGERLGQVVVAAGGEAGEAVGQRVTGRQEDDGRRSRPAHVAPEPDHGRPRRAGRRRRSSRPAPAAACNSSSSDAVPAVLTSNPSSRSPRVSSERSSWSSSSTMT